MREEIYNGTSEKKIKKLTTILKNIIKWCQKTRQLY